MVLQVITSFQFHSHQPFGTTTRTIEMTKVHPHPLKCMSTLGQAYNQNMIFTHKPTFQRVIMARPPAATTSLGSQVGQNKGFSYCSYWTDYFLNYVPEDVAIQSQKEQEVNELKEKVRKELLEIIAHKPTLQQLEILDDIQRLGLGYHFEDEIEEALNQIYEICHGNFHDLDLYHASLTFRLLRRHGFYIPSDIFKQFLNGNGNFKSSLSSDIEGTLSLYEASHLRAHGEGILDEALTFTTTQLKSMNKKRADNFLAAKVEHALEQPLHKGVARLESRHYISLYEQNPCHNKMLLKFAKLDFNLLQSLHKMELANLIRWGCDRDIYTKLSHNVRQVFTEIYFAALATMDERPKYSFGRIAYFKLIVVGTIIDDLYDLCEIGHLQLLTEALQRWDKRCANQLPDSLKFAYTNLLDAFKEVEHHLVEKGRSNAFHSALEFKNMWIFHLQSSKWCLEEHLPPFDAYMTTTMQSCGMGFCTMVGLLGLESEIATEEVFEWALQFPVVIQAVCNICKIMDDMAEDDPMEKVATQKPSVVSCYMKQHGEMNKDQAYEELLKMLDNPWKDINQAMLRPTTVSMPVLERMLTQARHLHVMLKEGDGFTCSDKTPMKKNLALMFRDPIDDVNL